ncbi:single-stranded DNA-binding protein [Halomonas sp. I5-271120]|uniref:single-stranded DNA-binding protein n=1 Tax=Halomonas sp. I5-271120 TaxID=3061632 RepID=UPI0027147051|nr:single-stranded DNA-binding protein [Halomonas sp. I5-271120]
MFHEAKTILVGNTSGAAEVRWTKGQEPKKVAKLRVVTEYGGGQNREPHKEWHTVILWGHLADMAEKFVTRSMQVYVEGRPQTRRWINSENQEVSMLEVIANTFKPLGYRKGDANQAAQPQSGQGTAQQGYGPGQGANAPQQPQGQPQAPGHQGQHAQPGNAPQPNQGQPAPAAQGRPHQPAPGNAPAPGNFGGGAPQSAGAPGNFDDWDEEIPF